MTLVLKPPTSVGVIGAGLAGLAAAHRLNAQGCEVVVYEARESVGGRAQTATDGFEAGQHADLGPELVMAKYRVLPRLCAELGVELSEPVSYDRPGADLSAAEALLGSGRLIIDGAPVEGEEFEALDAEIREALVRTPITAHEPLAQWQRRAGLSAAARGAVSAVGRMIAGVDPNQLDGYHVFAPAWGNVRRIVGGTQRLALALAEGLDLRLETPVRTIRQAGAVFVTTERGDTERFDRVVVAVPVHVVGTIGFDPPLEPSRLAALNAFQPAMGGKLVCQYAEGDAIRDALRHVCFSDGAVQSIWVANPYVTQGPAVITGFVSGRNRTLLDSPDAALGHLDDLVAVALGSPVSRIAGIVKNWSADRWALAATTTPGEAQRGELVPRVAQARVRLHFAGDYTDFWWTGTMEGAMRSGIRAADEILRRPTRVPLNEIDSRLVRG